MEQNTYRIPAHYVYALINDDYSGLSDADEKELNDWLELVKPGSATCPDGQPFFCHGNDINRNIGADCYDVVFIKQVTDKPNHYISMFQPVIDACKTDKDYAKAYERISSCVVGMISGRGLNEDFEAYLEKYPVKKEFVKWWHEVKDQLHLNAYGIAFKKPAQ